MRQLWAAYSTKVDGWSVRQRLAAFTAASVFLSGIVYGSMVEPSQARRQALTHEIRKQLARIDVLNAGIAGAKQLQASPRAGLDERRAELTRQITELDRALEDLRKNLVPADRVPVLLHELLQREPGLQLVSLRTLPAAPVLPERAQASGQRETTAARAAPVEHGMYKHGVELTVRGEYDALYRYLTRLERSASRMFWSRAQLQVQEYPRNTLVLTIYTLSLDKTWLQV